MIDATFVGRELPPTSVEVERRQLRFFAQVIGETNPVYVDVAAARAAGHPDLLVPPTFFFSLSVDTSGLLDEMGVDLRRVLHGEQRFTYHRLAHAGTTLTLRPRVADIYEKRGSTGPMEFIVLETAVSDPTGAVVADLRAVTVVRHIEVAA